MKIADITALGPVMPVIVIHEAEQALALADALLAGGIRGIEITLRTPAALAAIEKIADARHEMVIGAGTVLDGAAARDAKQAGAVFAVSPGTTASVIEGCRAAGLALLPGAASVSEMMALQEQGFDHLKFFPASAAGGVDFLKSLASPLPQLRFCPTGGINQASAPDWLALPNVPCLGGSWIATADQISAGDFKGIEARARAAMTLGRGQPARKGSSDAAGR